MLDDERGFTPAVWDGLAELGVLGVLVPTGAGGSGDDLVTMGVAIEESGRALLPGPLIASSVAAATALTDALDAVAVQPLLGGIADGDHVATVALHEPEHRYRLTAPSTTAADSSAGAWRLRGTKNAVLDAVAADTFVVSARAAGALELFIVERDDLHADAVRPDVTVDQTRKTATLVLDDTPARRLEVSDPANTIDRLADVTMTALVVDGVGAAGRALDLAVAYATERQQFGVPIGTFQAVQHLCADMLREVEMCRAGAYYALWACDAADPAERHRAAVMAKAYASDALPGVGEAAIKVFGGFGFTWEHDVHLYYKRLLSMAALFGNAGFHYDEIAHLVAD
jgi:alkylation response protein AidB-like acyl-CoA dehydrogenase